MQTDSVRGERSRSVVMTGTRGAAEIIGLSEGHLRNLRNKKSGPPFYKMGKAVRYAVSDCEAWRDAQRVCV